MIQFFKNSVRDFKHVVWPTKAETRKYFAIVLSVLVIFGLYIFILSSVFNQLMSYLDKVFK